MQPRRVITIALIAYNAGVKRGADTYRLVMTLSRLLRKKNRLPWDPLETPFIAPETCNVRGPRVKDTRVPGPKDFSKVGLPKT